MLLCVNFLPVLPEATESASQISSCASDENEAVDLSIEQHSQPDCASLTPSCDSYENEDVNFSCEQFTPDCTVDHTARTQHWVSQIPLVDTHHLPKALVPPADTCVTDNTCEDVNANDSSSVRGVLTSQTDVHDLCPETVTTARTRVGRVVRPVSRFIQTMNTQTLHTQTNKLRTWAHSLFSVNTM